MLGNPAQVKSAPLPKTIKFFLNTYEIKSIHSNIT